jgi:Uncharacterized protein conserved in bacteria (DUF2188)
MTKITYEIVEHDGGWAYRANGVFSETFSSHDAARKAAERAAKEQVVSGNTTGISYEDREGHWHDELSAGDDRPETDVKG